MTWYKTGTVQVTSGSPNVVGTGTSWVSGSSVGEAFYGPDGKLYEITNITSSTSLVISPNYAGSTASSSSYSIIPTQAYIRQLAQSAAALISDYSSITTAAGEASASATSAATSASNASASASSSTTSAIESATSATASAASATSSSTSATASTASSVASAASASSASTSATSAASASAAASTSATAAATSATSASTSASAASATLAIAIGGAGGDRVFIQNGNTVNNSYTIPTGYNAGTFGPVTVASGVTVTVPTGSVWTIV